MRKQICLFALLAILACAAHAEALPDGEYALDDFRFSGGSGKVTISCDSVAVEGGQAYASILFSSGKYGYVKVNGETIYGENTDKTSTFTIPVILNENMTILGMTTAMSQEHEIEYTLFFGLGEGYEAQPAREGEAGEEDEPEVTSPSLKEIPPCQPGDIPGLTWERRMDTLYATQFAVDYFEGGYKLLSIGDGNRYLLIPEGASAPEGLDESIRALYQPLDNIYLAATSAMALFDSLDALDRVKLSGTQASGWYVENAARAMEEGRILFAGKYSEPSYELLFTSGCDVAVESTMILHTPKVKEMLEKLGIPVFIERSSYEAHPLGRTEWIKLYGAMVDKEDLAGEFFAGQARVIEELKNFENTEKTVVFFYINSQGIPVVRSGSDYVSSMIEIAGGRYVFSNLGADSARSSVTVTMEEFYQAAVHADYLIYNAAIDDPIQTVDQLLAKSPLLADFDAVRNGNVWCTGKYLYQATDIVGELISDIHKMLLGETDDMTFLYLLK